MSLSTNWSLLGLPGILHTSHSSVERGRIDGWSWRRGGGAGGGQEPAGPARMSAVGPREGTSTVMSGLSYGAGPPAGCRGCVKQTQ